MVTLVKVPWFNSHNNSKRYLCGLTEQKPTLCCLLDISWTKEIQKVQNQGYRQRYAKWTQIARRQDLGSWWWEQTWRSSSHLSFFPHPSSPATVSASGASFLCMVAFSGFRVFVLLEADQSAGGLTLSGMYPQSINDGNWCMCLPAPSYLDGITLRHRPLGLPRGIKPWRQGSKGLQPWLMGCAPTPDTFPTPRVFFTQVDHLYLNPYLGIYFKGTQTKRQSEKAELALPWSSSS